MKKSTKILLISIAVVLCVVIVGGLFLFFSSSKYQIEHKGISRAYIYHNELEQELYELNGDEKQRLADIIENAELGGIAELEGVDGGPWFSIFCELENGRVVQVYSDGINFIIDSVPFKADEDSLKSLLALHNEIEDKVLPLSPELLAEIMNKRQ